LDRLLAARLANSLPLHGLLRPRWSLRLRETRLNLSGLSWPRLNRPIGNLLSQRRRGNQDGDNEQEAGKQAGHP
jgi:hypothetical protein